MNDSQLVIPASGALVRRSSSTSDMSRAVFRAASLRHDLLHSSSASHPEQQQQQQQQQQEHSQSTRDSLQELGDAIEQLGRTPSMASLNTENGERDRAYIPVTSSGRENLVMKQVVPNVVRLEKGPVQCFRVRDSLRRKRFVVLYPGDTTSVAAPEFLVVDEGNRRVVWSVRPGPSSGVKVLVKPESEYQIVLMRKMWVRNMKKVAEGRVYREGKGELAFSVRGDALGRRFSVHRDRDLIAQMHRTTHIAQPGKNVAWSFANVQAASLNQLVSRWEISVEKDVDTALMSAVMSVLERWMVEKSGRKG